MMFKNWVDDPLPAAQLSVIPQYRHGTQPLVYFHMGGSGLTMCHGMRLDQARELANHMLELANLLEGVPA